MSDAQNKENDTQASASVELKVPTPETTEATLEQSVDPPDDHKKCGPPPGKECDESKKCEENKPCEDKGECDKPCDEKCDKNECEKARCGDYGAPSCCDGNCGVDCKCGDECKCDEKHADQFSLLRERVPRNVRSSLAPMTRDLEDVCAQVSTSLHVYYQQANIKYEYSMLVVKTMEFVEDYRELSSEESKIVATRCVVEEIHRRVEIKEITEITSQDLMTAVPGSIEAVISMTKGEPLNRNVHGAAVVETAYVTNRVFEGTIEFIREHKYTIAEIMINIFIIAAHIMFIVGGFPALAGIQKKAIVIEVFTKLLQDYADDNGEKLPDHFIETSTATLPSMVDSLFNVAEGKFHINDIVNICCPLLFLCCSKKNLR
jgi:hypothetical protein